MGLDEAVREQVQAQVGVGHVGRGRVEVDLDLHDRQVHAALARAAVGAGERGQRVLGAGPGRGAQFRRGEPRVQHPPAGGVLGHGGRQPEPPRASAVRLAHGHHTNGRGSRSLASVLDLTVDAGALTAALVDVESVSGDEAHLADLVQAALAACPALDVERDGNVVIARTDARS